MWICWQVDYLMYWACAFLGLNGLLVAASCYGCVSQVLQWLKEGPIMSVLVRCFSTVRSMKVCLALKISLQLRCGPALFLDTGERLPVAFAKHSFLGLTSGLLSCCTLAQIAFLKNLKVVESLGGRLPDTIFPQNISSLHSIIFSPK